MLTGRIVRIVSNKYYGFIHSSNKDYFFHCDDFLGNWTQMSELINTHKIVLVEFEEVESSKGIRARNVRIVNYDKL